ncbi:hypothetical protein [Mobilicoccus caccae]|uniref:hypothetical protein n=1 Tax=Mobilicoccus caccae TaxID=1859295 RepID=UPI0024E131DF|nr:hypothetical protein [Mobilicoccus caccae]
MRRRVSTTIDPSRVAATVLQVGVRLDAPDDLTLGTAIGRLVAALALEGVLSTPVSHDATPEGTSALVAFLGDTST